MPSLLLLLCFLVACNAPSGKALGPQSRTAAQADSGRAAETRMETRMEVYPEHPAIEAAIRLGDCRRIRELVAHDPELLRKPMKVGFQKAPPLHLAVERNELKVAALLLELGADPSTRDAQDPSTVWTGGNTPLHRCKSAAMVRLLVNAGADVMAKDDDALGVMHAGLGVGRACGLRIAQALDAAGAPFDFETAVLLGTVGDVKRLLREDLPPTGMLHLAAARGDLEIVDALLQADVDPDGPGPESRDTWFFGDDDDASALAVAVQMGRFRVAEHLLETGAKPAGWHGWPDSRSCREGEGDLLERSAQDGPLTLVEALLEAGANPNKAPDRTGWKLDDQDYSDRGRFDTALARAANRGHLKVVEALLKHGANPNTDSDGATPLMHAAVFGHDKVVDVLLRARAKPTLHAVAAAGRVDVVRALARRGGVDARDSRLGETALMWAVRGGHANVVGALLELGADPTIPGSPRLLPFWRFAPLQCDLLEPPSPLAKALEAARVDIARLLVDAGAHPTVADVWTLAGIDRDAADKLLDHLFAQKLMDGESALAALGGALAGKLDRLRRERRCHRILDLGAGRYLDTPAATVVLRDADPAVVPPHLVGMLRRRGLRVNLKTACRFQWLEEIRKRAPHWSGDDGDLSDLRTIAVDGDRPQVLFCLRRHLAQWAFSIRETVEHAALCGARGVVIEMLRRGDVQLDYHSEGTSKTLLHFAACAERSGLAKELMRLGLDVDARDHDGCTALHNAALNTRPAIVRCLLENGADVHARANDGRTPLTLCLHWDPQNDTVDRVECVRLLLGAGADLMAMGFHYTALDALEQLATYSKHKDVYGVLLRQHARRYPSMATFLTLVK